MITEEKEREIRRSFRPGVSARAIARFSGVSVDTVLRIQRAHEIANKIPSSMKKEIRNLFAEGIGDHQIGARLNLPGLHIRDFRRYDRLDGTRVSKCKECGAAVFLNHRADREHANRKRMRGHVSRDDVRAISDIVTDLLSLGDLKLITHPLFYHLTQRAEKVYQKIHGKKKDTSKPRQVKRSHNPEVR